MSQTCGASVSQLEIEDEIANLESSLRKARRRLEESRAHDHFHNTGRSGCQSDDDLTGSVETKTVLGRAPSTSSAHYYLLLLSDSALPLGSFAFSSGLESYLAHTRDRRRRGNNNNTHSKAPPSFTSFLPLSVSSYASTTLPFVLAAHRDPSSDSVARLDDAYDASIICAVGRRASTAQGRALLSIWEKSLAPGLSSAGDREALKPFTTLLRASSSPSFTSSSSSSSSTPLDQKETLALLLPPPVSAHLAPLFGAVANLLGLTLRQTAYVFMLGHVKALVSAAVRASMFGPYQAQRILAGAETQEMIAAVVDKEWDTPVEEAGQTVPVMDLWIGRHEVLYSRIFNS